jgi:transcriptional regulator with XRE-family HTH domain
MASIADRLLILRRAKKLSQSELGDIVDVTRETIGKYERGDNSPSLDTACKIADVLGVSLDYLAGTGKKASHNSELLDLVDELEQLPPDMRKNLLFFVNAVIRDYKTRQAHSM